MNHSSRPRTSTAPRTARFGSKTIAAAAAVVVLQAALIFPASSAEAETQRINVRQGSIGDGQTTAALDTADQSGQQDNWDRYVEFFPGNRRHRSVLTVTPEGSGDDELTVDVNFRGPNADTNEWTLAVYDRQARRWVTVFDNDDVEEWTWDAASTTVDDPERFLDSRGRARLLWKSSNDDDVSQLDYVALTRSGDSEPTPTTAPPTTAPPTTAPPTTPVPATTTPVPPTTAPTTPPPVNGIQVPPVNAQFDYQIGGDYALPAGVTVVSRDWFAGASAANAYNICYVNAFQTQPDDGSGRPDLTSQWPSSVVLTGVADDPNWPGEYLIDISTATKRQVAASHVEQMVNECARKGFDAVEFDNLDSWTRFDDIPALADSIPFGQSEAVLYATLLTDYAHSKGLAVGQKNTAQIIGNDDHREVGFDFAIVEQCGEYNECGDFTAGYGDNVIAIEYTASGFNRACSGFGDRISIVRRNVDVRRPGAGYIYQSC